MRCKSEETMEQIKNAVEEFYFSHYRSPSIGELAAEVGYAKSTVHSYLWEMDRRGLLSYNGKTAETAVTRKANAEVVLTPVLGGISCGQPEYAEEDFEAYVALPTALFGSGEFFLLRAATSKDGKNRYEYHYDHNGLRTGKTMYSKETYTTVMQDESGNDVTVTKEQFVKAATIEYIWSDGILVGYKTTAFDAVKDENNNYVFDEFGNIQTEANNIILVKPIYNKTNEIVGVSCCSNDSSNSSSETFYFAKDAQGNIMEGILMKKQISIFLTFLLVCSVLMTGFTAQAEQTQEKRALRGFIDGITQLVREYDADKDFAVSEPEKTDPEQTFSVTQNDFAASASTQNTEENSGDSTDPAYTLQDFQTARLIVRASGNFDGFGALENVSGFEDFHILQYESPEAAMEAYENLQVEKNITEVNLDLVCTYCGYESTPEDPDIITKDEFLNDWSRDRTQSKRLQEYLAEADIPMKEIIVGVVDSGIDYTHEIFEGRVERTYFNVSSSGNADDEMDDEISYHGTTVSSVIVNNSPKNVKVAVYKVGDNDSMTVTAIGAGLLAAIEKCDVINTSLSSLSDISLITEIVLKAYSKNIPVFAAVGNSSFTETSPVPANVPECIAVSATDFNNTIAFMNTKTPNSDVSAPGENVAVAIPGDRYVRFSGTSYSTPCAAALGAILKSVTPEITVDEIDAQLKETSFDAKRCNERQSSQGGFMDNYHSLWDGVGMIQFCNALGLEKLTVPEIHLEDKVYIGEQTCTITCPDEKAIVLYTTDGTYPAFENADVYTEPFQITQRTRIRAVAYYADGGYYSDEVETTPRIQYTDSDENFAISNDGIITKYNGNISDLYVPETINGITVTGFDKGAFNTVIGLTLPKTVTEIPASAFSTNSIIEFVRGEGIVTVKSSAFSQSNIMYVEFPAAEYIQAYAFYAASKFCSGYFPNVEIIEGDAFSYSRIISFYGPEVQEIDDGAFGQCSRLEKVYFPQCTIINVLWGPANGVFDSCSRLVSVEMPLITNLTFAAFNNTSISKADFPFIKTIEEKAFYNCFELEYINMTALLTVPKQAFGSDSFSLFNKYTKLRSFRLDSVTQIEQDAFGKHPTARIELSHLESAKSLPQTEGCIITMPSTFKECTEDTVGRNYKVYGTKGTYAEEWANANGHEFIEISQETALLQDVPMEYTDETQVLCPDVIGFNRTYQWYGSLTADNTAGEPIEGATEKAFDPADYPAYPYYYCIVTSTDIGFEPVEIRTGVTANKVASADYTAYNQAVAEANALDRNLYKDLTALDAALSVDVSGKNITEQTEVDAQTAAIIDALESLQYKPADYSNVESAKAKIPTDLSTYTDDSRKQLQAALDAVDYSLNITEQAQADAYAEAIIIALDGLKRKPTEPVTPEKPTNPESTTGANPSADSSADASRPQAPEIPQTGVNDAQVVGAAFVILLSLLALYSKRREKTNF